MKNKTSDNVDSFESACNKLLSEPLEVISLSDYNNMAINKNFLVDKLIYPKTVTMLYSPPASFKSILSYDLAIGMATGTSFLGYECKPSNVLYLDGENSDITIQERLKAMSRTRNISGQQVPMYMYNKSFDIYSDLRSLENTIVNYDIKVIFFDTIRRFVSFDENNSAEVSALYTQVFQTLIDKYGVTIIFLHHTNKSGDYRGSIDLMGMVDTCYKIQRNKKLGLTKGEFKLINEKNRSGEVENIKGNIDFILDSNNNLDKIDITLLSQEEDEQESPSEPKFKEIFIHCSNYLKEHDLGQRKDFEAYLTNNGIDYSLTTLKRALNWGVKKNMFVVENYKYRIKSKLEF